MTVVEAISQKVVQLPPKAQEEVLDLVEHIASRYTRIEEGSKSSVQEKHPLDKLLEISIEGPPDLAERHDFYAHGKLED